MRTFASRVSMIGLSLALVALGSACQGEETDDETAPADTSATAMSGGETVSSGIQPGVSSTYSVAINNPMPHAMVVKVEYTGGGETELGTVPAGSEQAFTVAASAGETVTLVATDEAGTHSPSTTMVLPTGQSETSWTIE
ncbi:MAG TPA: hypothetical protein VIE68_01735 [Gemmatimonadota bacterium]|jgi:hypothetical protein